MLNAVENYKQQHVNWFDNPAIKRAVLAGSFFSPVSLGIIAATILTAILMVIIFYPAWVMAATLAVLEITVGLGMEIGWLWISLNNQRQQTKAIAKHLHAKNTFSLSNIHDERLKAKLLKALRYWWLINDKLSALPRGPMQKRVAVTHRYVTRWLQTVYTLARQADMLLLETVITQDMQNVPAIVKQHEEALLHEQDPTLQKQLEQALIYRRQQLQTLQAVQNNLKQVYYKLDGTLSALGMIYSQLLLAAEGGQQANKINRLQADVTEEIHRLQDLIEAMNEVHRDNY